MTIKENTFNHDQNAFAESLNQVVAEVENLEKNGPEGIEILARQEDPVSCPGEAVSDAAG